MVHVVTLVKQTPDVDAIRIDPKTGEPDFSGVGVKVSDYDKNAVEAAVQLKEGGAAQKVTTVSLGGDKLEESVKEVLAMGADEAVLLRDPQFQGIDTAEKTKVLAAAVRKLGDVDLVLAAEESADSHTAQTGPRVSELLGWPLLSYVTKLELADGKLKVEREVDEGIEVVECPLPAVITVLESLNEPRLPALMQILQAKNKPMQTWGAADVGVEAIGKKVQVLKNVAPKSERKQEFLEADSPEEAATKIAQLLEKEGVIG